MYWASVKYTLSKIDQENLEKKIQMRHKRYEDDYFFFRPCTVSPADGSPDDEKSHKNCVDGNITQNLLSIHQTSWQK